MHSSTCFIHVNFGFVAGGVGNRLRFIAFLVTVLKRSKTSLSINNLKKLLRDYFPPPGYELCGQITCIDLHITEISLSLQSYLSAKSRLKLNKKSIFSALWFKVEYDKTAEKKQKNIAPHITRTKGRRVSNYISSFYVNEGTK